MPALEIALECSDESIHLCRHWKKDLYSPAHIRVFNVRNMPLSEKLRYYPPRANALSERFLRLANKEQISNRLGGERGGEGEGVENIALNDKRAKHAHEHYGF